MISRYGLWITMRCNLQIYLFIYFASKTISCSRIFLLLLVCGLNGSTSHTQTIRTIHLRKFSIKFVSRGEGEPLSILWRVSFPYNGQTADGGGRRCWNAKVTVSCIHFMATNNLLGRSACNMQSGSHHRRRRHRSTCCICVEVWASHTTSSSGSSAYKITIRSMRMNMNSYLFVHMNYTCDFVMCVGMRCDVLCVCCETAHAKVHTDSSFTHFALMQSSQTPTEFRTMYT